MKNPTKPVEKALMTAKDRGEPHSSLEYFSKTVIFYLFNNSGDALLSCDQRAGIKRKERSALFGILVWPLGGSPQIE